MVVRFVELVRKELMEFEAYFWLDMESAVDVWFIRVFWRVTPGEVAPPM